MSINVLVVDDSKITRSKRGFIMSINVLVVDDSKITRSVIKKTIKIAGIDFNKIFEAENGKEALEVLGNEWIDLIFTDINMPIMGGAELFRSLLFLQNVARPGLNNYKNVV